MSHHSVLPDCLCCHFVTGGAFAAQSWWIGWELSAYRTAAASVVAPSEFMNHFTGQNLSSPESVLMCVLKVANTTEIALTWKVFIILVNWYRCEVSEHFYENTVLIFGGGAAYYLWLVWHLEKWSYLVINAKLPAVTDSPYFVLEITESCSVTAITLNFTDMKKKKSNTF